MGARFYTVAAQFQEYLIESIRFKYCPANSSSGADETVAGATTTPGYSLRTFAWGVITDPAVTSSFLNGVEAGLKIARTTSPSTLYVNTPHLHKWRFTSTTTTGASPPSSIDYRMIAPLKLLFYFSDTSTTTTARYGFIQYDAVVAFRGPLNNVVPIGLTISKEETKEESKEELVKVVPEEVSSKDFVNPSLSMKKSSASQPQPLGKTWSLFQ